MAFGDYSGSCTQLVITCEGAEGSTGFKGDSVALVGPYTVSNKQCAWPIFGEALRDWDGKQAIPVKVRGVSRFKLRLHGPCCAGSYVACDGFGGVHPYAVGALVLATFNNDTEVDVLL